MSPGPARSARRSYDAWTRARPANDFATMLPFLEKAVDLSREYAGFFAPYKHVADPLIDAAEEGMTTATIRSLFAGLRSELIPIVRAISDQPVPSDDCLRGSFSEQAQLDFSLSVVKQFGYDTDRGRLDKTHHPFCTKFSAGRRPDYHSRRREAFWRRAVFDHARGRSCALRARCRRFA